MWAPLAAALAKDHTVIVPDLRGMGLSSYPDSGYDKKTQAQDIVRVMDKLNVQKADLVTHDIGNMVGYALAAQYPDRITRWAVIDAPLPGIGPWDEILKSPMLWHFNFRGPDVDRLVKGRERIYLDRFWNELSANPKRSTRRHANTTPKFMRGPERCTPRSISLPRFRKTHPTTRRLRPKPS
jgi:pimeloyl-ACP methyl ester carboxylesterase